jgi:glycosyltransferase involved in cell wall biosynthesis
MRVLFLTYPRIGLNRGGLQIQIEETAKGLAELGVEVIRYDPWKNEISNVDICHVFSIDGATAYHVTRAVAERKPVVITPVFSSFKCRPLLTRLKVNLSGFMPGMYSDLKRARIMLRVASRILALNAEEKQLVASTFSLPSTGIEVVSNGIDLRFVNGDPTLFMSRYGVDNFVLNVASLNPNKNQLSLVRAMSTLGYPLVLIGKITSENTHYYDLCRKEVGASRVIFVGELAHEDPLLASAYAAAKLFVLPSHSEVMPLSLYEAAISGCSVITSRNVPIAAPLRHYTTQFSPGNIEALRNLIDAQMKSPTNSEFRRAVATMPSWGDVSGHIKSIYEDVVSNTANSTCS